MTLSRPFQLGAMVVCVAALAGIYLNTRGHSEITDDDSHFADAREAPPTPSPSTPASTSQPAGKPLPKSKAEILAELTARGLTLNEAKPGGTAMYAVKGAPLGIGFREHDGKLLQVEAMALAGMAEKNPTELRGWAATVGEVSTGLPRGGVLQVVDLLLADVGSSPRGFNRTVDDGTQRFKIDATRHDDGAYSITFAAE